MNITQLGYWQHATNANFALAIPLSNERSKHTSTPGGVGHVLALWQSLFVRNH
jgi:hypothetical protein